MKGGKGAPFALYGKGFEQGDMHSNCFVGNLQQGTTQADLEAAFSAFGPVQSAFAADKEGKSYGFVKMMTVEGASLAIASLNGANGWIVKMANKDSFGASFSKGGFGKDSAPASSASKPTHTNVFVGSLKEGLTDAQLEKVFKAYGTVDSCVVMNKGEDKTYGFVEFSMISEAQAAIAGMHGQEGLVVKFSNNDNVPMSWDEAVPHSNLFVGSLPKGMHEGELRRMCERHGSVQSCSIKSDADAEQSYGFVKMTTIAAARRVIKALSGHQGFHCTTTPEQLNEVFGKVGEVKWSRILPFQGWPNLKELPEGSALIQFATPEQAQGAIAEFDGKLITDLGVRMSIRYAEEKVSDRPEAKPNSNLYVKGWPLGFPDFLLQSVFQSHGQVVRVRLLDNPDSEQPTQAALVLMSREEEATAALKALHGHTVKVPVPAMRVKHAGRDPTPSGNLYVFSLPRTITDQEIRETFKKYGEVVRLKFLNQDGNPEMRVLVELSSPQLAQQAVRELDGSAPVFKGPMLYIQYASRKEGKEGGKGKGKGD